MCLSPPRADCSFNLKELIIHLKVIVLQNVFTPFIVEHVEMIESALPIEEEVLIGGVILCFFFWFFVMDNIRVGKLSVIRHCHMCLCACMCANREGYVCNSFSASFSISP